MFEVATAHMPLSKQQPAVTPAKKTFSRWKDQVFTILDLEEIDKIILHFLLNHNTIFAFSFLKWKETCPFYLICPLLIPRKMSTWKTITDTNSLLNSR